MRKTPGVIGALAVTGLLLVGCGSSDSDSGSGSDDGGGGEATTTMAQGPMTDAELSALLLTPEELGTGWTLDTTSSGGSQAPSCLQNLGDSGPKAVADAEAEFQNGETVFAAENLGAQASEADAETAWEKVTDALDTCSDVTLTSNGQPVTGTITPNGEGDVGDGSKSYTMAFTVQGVPLTIDIVVAHVGVIDMLVLYGAVGDANPEAVTTMVEAAVEKVEGGMTA